MKNPLSLPDDIFETILAFDGRYDKSRLMPSLRIIDCRIDIYDVLSKYPNLNVEWFKEQLHNQRHCWEQKGWGVFGFIQTPSYKKECQLMANKYTKQCDELTGCIKGKTPIKKTLNAMDKRFSNVLSCFTLSKFREKRTQDANGVIWKSQKIYGVSVGTSYCEYGLHMKDYYAEYCSVGKNVTVRGEKNGIEVLDPKFIRTAKKTHRGQLLIKKMLKL